MTGRPVVFFELGFSIGQVSLGADSIATGFEMYSSTAALLPELSRLARLGVIASGPQWSEERARTVLRESRDQAFFEADLIFHVVTLSPTELRNVAARAGVQPADCVYVCRNRTGRSMATQSGMRAVPHPALVEAVLKGEQLAYVRFDADAVRRIAPRPGQAAPALAPLNVGREDGKPTLYAISSKSVRADLLAAGVDVQEFVPGADVALTDACVLYGEVDRLENDNDDGLLPAGLRGHPTDDGVIVAVPADAKVDDLHPLGRGHARARLLVPSWTNLTPTRDHPAFPDGQLDAQDIADLRTLDEALIRRHLDRWCGLAPLEPWPVPEDPPADKLIISRHVAHPHNRVAVLGITATLKGILGADAARPLEISSDYPGLLNVEGELRGTDCDREILIVGAHLDSTAANSPNFDGSNGRAPGADDDGSGIAAVLATAEVLKRMSIRKPPRRTIRFVLFNDEEYSMVGSTSYVMTGANLTPGDGDGSAPPSRIVAMLQMDMIGYLRSPYPRACFELHTLAPEDLVSPDEDFVARCNELARLVADARQCLSPDLDPAEFYPLDGCPHDPAYPRSDHAPFIANKWPACLISEDFYTKTCTLISQPPSSYDHPGYHRQQDTKVNYRYAADIARLVAAAVWRLANG